jgi:alpha-beta hydrolase superfamily lysophospholipase
MTRRGWLFAVVALVAAAPSLGASTDVSMRADDGVALAAVWSAPPQPAAAVLLVHSYLRSHADWDATASRLHDAGLGVLALDLRGHGRSAGTAADQFQMFPRDVKAALGWLKAQPDVLPGRIGIAGLSMGATLAVIAAGSDPAVRSIGLVSPATEFRGLRCDAAMHVFAARSGAAYVAAGSLDPYGSRSARQLADIEPGLRDLQLLDGTSANGRVLLQEQPDVVTALVEWFRRTL